MSNKKTYSYKVDMVVDWEDMGVLIEEVKGLRLLKKNLESGVIMRISPELVRLLMERDWTNG